MQFRVSSAPDLTELDALIVPVDRDGEPPATLAAEARQLAAWVARESGPQKLLTATTHLQQSGEAATRLIIVAAGRREDYDMEHARQAVSSGIRALWRSTARRIGVVLDTESLDPQLATQAAVEGVLYALWRPTTHRTAEDELLPPPLDTVELIGPAGGEYEAAIELGTAVGEAVNWARRMANEPANLLTPTRLGEEAGAAAEAAGMTSEILDEETCRALGMNSFLSVARGSHEPARFIVLRYRGGTGDGHDLGLVGKGITFDSGGISIKPADDMHVMKYDMSGAAAVIAAGVAIARLRLPLNLIVAAPCTENLPGGQATKPGDVVTSLSGKTVEVINTDAEGRLVLIDGVTYVEREGARRVVDVATLTGAIRIALGLHFTGVFGRPASFVDELQAAGSAAGERLWPMPLTDEYRDEIQGEVADLRNSAGRLGSAIKGAAFIEAGVSAETPWAHLDIAGSSWLDDERPSSPKGPQGTPVRTLVALAAAIAGRQRADEP